MTEPRYRHDVLAVLGIIVVVLTACWPVVTSGDRINPDPDFFQYIVRHEQVRQGILRDHTLTQRSHLLGGGFPTLGDPENPTFNPLVLVTFCLGSIVGIKWIGILVMLFGAVSLYLLARKALGYGLWGALASALFFGLCLWLPVRMRDGNPNEIYCYYIPACLLCLFMIRSSRKYLFVLVGLLLAMLADGKQTFIVAVMFIGFMCCCWLVPGVICWGRSARSWPERSAPAKWLAIALALAFVLGLFRILPAVEVIRTEGSLFRMPLYHNEIDMPAGYEFSRLCSEATAWKGDAGLRRRTSVCIGWVPLILAALALFMNWRQAAPWLAGFLLFVWLAMARDAPFDLFRYLWTLPIMNTIADPAKYFSCVPVLCVCVLAGQTVDRLARLRHPLPGRLIAALAIGLSVLFLYPKVWAVSDMSYTGRIPVREFAPSPEFFQIYERRKGINSGRIKPFCPATYVNIRCGVGTINWHKGLRFPQKTVPRYFLTLLGKYLPNPDYRGECFWLTSGQSVSCEVSSHRISAEVSATRPETLIINQNYHRDWRTNHGKLHEWQGLLAVDLPPGQHNVELRYFSRAFAIGLGLSLVCLIGVVAIAVLYGKGRIARWANSQSRWIRTPSRVLMAILA